MNRRGFLQLLAVAPVAAAATPAIAAKAADVLFPDDGVALLPGARNTMMSAAELSKALLPGLTAVFECAYEGHQMTADRDVCTRCGMTAEAIEELGGDAPHDEEWAALFNEDSLETIEIEIERGDR